MPQLVLFLALAGVGPVDIDAFSVRVKIDADHLEVDGKYELELFVSMAEGWSSSEAGMPAPILQIQVPACVKLDGEVLHGQHRQGISRKLTVHLATMTDRDHYNDQDVVEDLIHDAVVTGTHTPQGRGSATLEFLGPRRSGIGRQGLDLLTHATADSELEAGQLPGCRPLNLYSI